MHFLLVCLMGLSEELPDEDALLQCTLRLDVINNELCNSYDWKLQHIQKWQMYMFHFVSLMADVFKMDVKLNSTVL